MLGSGLNLVTTVIGFGMSATFIVFVCARLICGRARSADSRDVAFDLELRSDLEASEHGISGLEPVVVAAIPTMKYKREAFQSREDAQCSICLGEYEEKEVLRIMPSCGHSFHLACIDVWLQKQATCPICRLPLNDAFDAKYAASPLFDAHHTVGNPEGSSDRSNQWLLPGHQRSEASENNQEIHESVSVVIAVPHGENREARA
ncbi:RING-H2 finger protein ATL7-like [Phoenix dactylifera]|uniref:RING-H2 finger protein ATL7-like n=1 Tax=Phoenix dactylifera TaxID=42345 RepID=A0A8B7CNZ5_PHODC|nr:RING-H2 finger protein ATL7-like [Phoenix dactylifera]XP_038978679.1 RING-H2 finger protein ATL7-like [Phoenix dactylifera]